MLFTKRPCASKYVSKYVSKQASKYVSKYGSKQVRAVGFCVFFSNLFAI